MAMEDGGGMGANEFDAYGQQLIANLERRLRSPEPHQADYEVFRYFSDESGLFVDVGANFGISVASLRLYNPRLKVVSFEPLPWMEPPLRFLKEREGDLFDYHIVALGRHEGTMTIEVPMVGDTPNFFRASGDRGKFSIPQVRENVRQSLKLAGDVHVVPITVPVSRLDAFNLQPSIIKIDVEGLEWDVLVGGQETINACKPVVFLELSKRKEEILNMMSSAGYTAYIYREGRLQLFDEQVRTDNVIFLLPSHLP